MGPFLGDLKCSEPEVGDVPRSLLLQQLSDAEGLISLLNVSVDQELLERADKLRVVANFAVGYDNVDVDAATKRGVIVTNTPDVLTNATADAAFALLLAAARRLGEAERLVRSGRWTGWAPGLLLGREFSGRTLGVIGAGRIGCAVLRRAAGFDMRLLYSGPRCSTQADALGAQYVSTDDLLRGSDFVSLHCPLNSETNHLINSDTLSRMKKTAVFVNTARGGCVDHEALADALEADALAGVGLDVFEEEPKVPKRLLMSERAVLVPHIASATWTARSQMAEICARAVHSVLTGTCPPTALNPEAMR